MPLPASTDRGRAERTARACSGRDSKRATRPWRVAPATTLGDRRRARVAARALTLLASLASVAVLVAGCGSSSPSGSSVDPADVVPASAPLYAGAIVRPEGSLQTAARDAGQTLTHQADPYLRLLSALQTPGAGTLDFKRDVSPWLGPRAGVFLTAAPSGDAEAAVSKLLTLVEQGLLGRSSAGGAFPFAAQSVEGAIVMDTSDTAKARSFVSSVARRAGAHTASYRGVSYQVTSSGIAFGVVARLVVIGTERALHGVVDTTSGGPALAHASGYAKLLAAAPAGALAHVFVDPEALAAAAGSKAKVASSIFSLLAGNRTVNVSLVPSKTSIAIDADTPAASDAASGGGLLSSGAQAATALAELPGESWLAAGLGNLGATLGQGGDALQSIASLGGLAAGSGEEGQSAGISIGGLLSGILAPLRAIASEPAAARSQLTRWMGSGGLFASGTGLLELKGAIVIESKDRALSRAAVAKIAAKLRAGGSSVQSAAIPGTDAAVAARLSGLPVVLYIADGTDSAGKTKFVIGVGEASVQEALSPSSALSGAAAYTSASAELSGAHPSVIVDFPTLLGLLEGVGLTEDPTIAPFVPYLRSLTTLSGGAAGAESGIERFRLVLGLQQQSG